MGDGEEERRMDGDGEDPLSPRVCPFRQAREDLQHIITRHTYSDSDQPQQP